MNKLYFIFLLIILLIGCNNKILTQENEQIINITGTKWLFIEEDPDDNGMPPIVIDFQENGILHDRMLNDGHTYEQRENIVIIYWNQYEAASIGFLVSDHLIKGILINRNLPKFYGNFRMERIID